MAPSLPSLLLLFATALEAARRASRNATSAGLHTTGLARRTSPSSAASRMIDSNVTISSKSSPPARASSPISSRHLAACASSALVKTSLATLGGSESRRALSAAL